jgi:hypothetical protein
VRKAAESASDEVGLHSRDSAVKFEAAQALGGSSITELRPALLEAVTGGTKHFYAWIPIAAANKLILAYGSRNWWEPTRLRHAGTEFVSGYTNGMRMLGPLETIGVESGGRGEMLKLGALQRHAKMVVIVSMSQ